jgi:hypothetical protein
MFVPSVTIASYFFIPEIGLGVGGGAKNCFDMAQDRGEVVDSCECGDGPLGSIK